MMMLIGHRGRRAESSCSPMKMRRDARRVASRGRLASHPRYGFILHASVNHTSRNKVITHLVQGSRLIPVIAQPPGRDLSNTKGSVQRPELNLWFSLVKVQLAEVYSQYFTDIHQG